MDLASLKHTADLAHNIAVEKQNALERLRSRQLLVYQDHVFVADAATITMAHVLREANQGRPSYLLDSNNNPCRIDDMADFVTRLVEKNQEALNSYHQIFQSFRRK